MKGEQELQYKYGLSEENLNRVKNSFMKFLRKFLDKNKTKLELDRGNSSVQKEIQANFERTWEEACLELVTHPQEYCPMDELLPVSREKNLAWAVITIIKVQLEMTLRLEQKENQSQQQLSDSIEDSLRIKKKHLEKEELRLNIQKQLSERTLTDLKTQQPQPEIEEKPLDLSKRLFDPVNVDPGVLEKFATPSGFAVAPGGNPHDRADSPGDPALSFNFSLPRRFEFVDLQEKKLEWPRLRLKLGSKNPPNSLKSTAAIITGSLLFLVLLFGQALTHSNDHLGPNPILPTTRDKIGL